MPRETLERARKAGHRRCLLLAVMASRACEKHSWARAGKARRIEDHTLRGNQMVVLADSHRTPTCYSMTRTTRALCRLKDRHCQAGRDIQRAGVQLPGAEDCILGRATLEREIAIDFSCLSQRLEVAYGILMSTAILAE